MLGQIKSNCKNKKLPNLSNIDNMHKNYSLLILMIQFTNRTFGWLTLVE
jgi:hypothetical protein